jgi:hypothetical protein
MLGQVFNPTEIKKNGPATRPAIAPARRVAFLLTAGGVVLPDTRPKLLRRGCTVNRCWSSAGGGQLSLFRAVKAQHSKLRLNCASVSRWIQRRDRTRLLRCVDVEAHDAPVRTAIASGRLASLQPAVLGRLIESAVILRVRMRAIFCGPRTDQPRNAHNRQAEEIAWADVGAVQRADLAELADWVEGLRAAAQTARVQGNITLADALDVTRFEVYESYLDEELDHQQSQAAARRGR